jgi:uncharacterized protein YjbJ (UPF0337 family)
VTRTRDALDEARPGSRADDGFEESVTEATDDTDATTAEIRDDIDTTRTEMGETLGELGDRLDPARVLSQAKENVREATIGRVEHAVEDVGESAKGTTDMLINTIKENPIPTALAGAGIFMLWRNRSREPRREAQWRARSDAWAPNGRRYDDARGGDGAASTIRQAAGAAAGSVGETAGNVASTVGEAAGNAGQLAGEAVEQGRQTAMEVGSQLDRYMQASPLAMGAIAYGVGAVVGALLPETDQEREMLAGPAEQVSGAVRDTVNQAMDAVEGQADTAERELSRT